jgi:hypothetical protein
LAELDVYVGQDYAIITTPKALMTEVLFIDWLYADSLTWVETRGQKMHYDGLVVLLFDGHDNCVTPRVIASAGCE